LQPAAGGQDALTVVVATSILAVTIHAGLKERTLFVDFTGLVAGAVDAGFVVLFVSVGFARALDATAAITDLIAERQALRVGLARLVFEAQVVLATQQTDVVAVLVEADLGVAVPNGV
jgi:hypothetical protein